MPIVALPVDCMVIATTMVASPTIEPTEMSSPPETITTVWAMARMPRMVMARPILTRLRGRKNTSGRSEPKIATRMTSASRNLDFACRPGRRFAPKRWLPAAWPRLD